MESAKEHVSEAQHNARIVMSEILRTMPFAAQNSKAEVVTKLRNVLTLLGDAYTLLASVHLTEQ